MSQQEFKRRLIQAKRYGLVPRLYPIFSSARSYVIVHFYDDHPNKSFLVELDCDVVRTLRIELGMSVDFALGIEIKRIFQNIKRQNPEPDRNMCASHMLLKNLPDFDFEEDE